MEKVPSKGHSADKRVRDLELLIQAGRLLNSTLDLRRLLGFVIKIVERVIRAEEVAVLFMDDPRDNLILEFAKGVSNKGHHGLKIPVGEGVAGRVARSGKPLILNEARRDKELSFGLEKKLGLKPRSIICIPLKRRGKVIGVLECINNQAHGTFTSSNLDLLMVLGDQISVAVDNARLYDRMRKRDLENRMLRNLSATLSKSLSLDEVLHRILTSLKEIVRYDAAGVFVLDKKNLVIVSEDHHSYDTDMKDKIHLKLDEGIVGWSARNKKGVIVSNCRLDSRYVNAREQTCSEMVAPMLVGGDVIGLLNLESDQLDAYSEDDLTLLQSFANHAAVAIERARLYEKNRKRRRLQREIKVARTVQEFFTPRRGKRYGDFCIRGANYPGQTVSGDYYDFFPLRKGLIAFAIADVAGKGVPASIIMSSFRASLHTGGIHLLGARDIASTANRILLETVRPQDFVTAFIGVLDPKRHTINYCNAGHNPPILMSADGRHRFLEMGGTVLGAFADPKLVEGHLKLDSEILFGYTDGLTEARNGKGEEFGIDRVTDVLKQSIELTVQQTCSKMYQSMRAFTGKKELMDDVTFLVLKRCTSK